MSKKLKQRGLTFVFTDFSDEDYKILVQSNKMYFVLTELAERIRKKLKYEDLSRAESDAWYGIKESFWELVNEHKIDLSV